MPQKHKIAMFKRIKNQPTATSKVLQSGTIIEYLPFHSHYRKNNRIRCVEKSFISYSSFCRVDCTTRYKCWPILLVEDYLQFTHIQYELKWKNYLMCASRVTKECNFNFPKDINVGKKIISGRCIDCAFVHHIFF